MRSMCGVIDVVSRSELEDILEDVESISRRLRRVLRDMEGMDLHGDLQDVYDDLESAYAIISRALQQLRDYVDFVD